MTGLDRWNSRTVSFLRFAGGQALSEAKGLSRSAARSFPFVPQGFGSRAQDDRAGPLEQSHRVIPSLRWRAGSERSGGSIAAGSEILPLRSSGLRLTRSG